MPRAKQYLREVLFMEPKSELKGLALSNLATACWWHKHPNYHNYNPLGNRNQDLESQKESEEEYAMKQKDFEQAVTLYKNSLFFLEDVKQTKIILR